MPNYVDLAEELITRVQRFHREEHPHPSEEVELQSFLQSLQKQGVVKSCSDRRAPEYLIRQRVTGSPILLDARDNEVVIRHIGFATHCYEILIAREGKDVSLLQVLL